MAKMKSFAVEVEFTVKRTVYVTARREGGAREKLSTVDGIHEAFRYDDDPEADILMHVRPENIKITRVREAGA